MRRAKLHLIRHGTTDGNVAGLFLGRTDLPLNEVGVREAARLADRLRTADFGAVYSSGLIRARATADAIGAAHAPPLTVRPDSRLREMDLGDFDGLLASDVHAAHPELIERWRHEPQNVRMPGPTAETLGEVQHRAIAALTEIASEHTGQNVAVVTHTFVLLGVVCHVLGVPLAHFRRLFLDRASITVVDWGADNQVLRRFNDIAHLV